LATPMTPRITSMRILFRILSDLNHLIIDILNSSPSERCATGPRHGSAVAILDFLAPYKDRRQVSSISCDLHRIEWNCVTGNTYS
ncbi:MAG: hypothetical protein ACLP2X_26940, partial [Syntrophobacteraceae bacterium]